MVVTLGQQYNVEEKPIVILYTYINHHAQLVVQRKIITRLDLLSIPLSGGKNVKTFRWDHRLQIQNLFIAFKRVPLW